MIGGGRVVLGLDVGSTKTCAVIAEHAPTGNGAGEALHVLGIGIAPSAGMSGPTVTNLEATTASVRSSVQQAEEMAGREVDRAFIGLAGAHVDVAMSSGVVAVAGAEVDSRDVRRVEEVGRAVPLGPDAELIHALCLDYTVDGRSGIEDPVGMEATRLESEVCLVTARTSICRDLRKAVDRAGYRPVELVLEPLASSLAVLKDSERDTGVALVEIGGSATDLVVFEGRRIRALRTFPWGARTVTRDIAKGLGVPEDEAERLKAEHGVALRSRVDAADEIDVSGPGYGSGRKVSRALLAHIIEQRLDEILGLVYDQLEENGFLDRLGTGVVLTGGGASLPGTVALARSVFNRPVRQGAPGPRLSGAAEAVSRPDFATGVGLAMYGNSRGGQRTLGGATRVLGRLGDWLKDFF
jgi:cell division protein FtsA